jgi:hypothetical protein
VVDVGKGGCFGNISRRGGMIQSKGNEVSDVNITLSRLQFLLLGTIPPISRIRGMVEVFVHGSVTVFVRKGSRIGAGIIL